MNKVILIGNLSRDIELRYMQNGSAIATTSIAVTEKFKKQDGQARQQPQQREYQEHDIPDIDIDDDAIPF